MKRRAKATMVNLKCVVERLGGTLEKDGMGGYEAVAPPLCRWIDAEVSSYPIPLSEAETKEERQDMLDTAFRMLKAGIEPISSATGKTL